MCILFCSSFVCRSTYANVYSITTFIKQNIKIILIAGVPKSQAAPVYLITAHHPCAFLMYLARQLCGGFKQKKMWVFETQERKKERK
jgi:hypothetical protein